MGTRQTLAIASAVTAVIALVALVGTLGSPSGVAALIEPGQGGPSAEVVAEDFPDAVLEPDVGHDGQQFYAIARAPMHLDEVSDALDRPRYRLQRPLFAWAAWLLHPSGGGPGLVLALFAVGVFGIVLLATGSALLSMRLGGTAWPALVVPVLPGVFVSLRISVADNLALALALTSVYLALNERTRSAAVTAVLAVLTKEAMLALLIGQALLRRRRPEIVAALAGVGVAGAWWMALRLLVDVSSEQVVEFTLPFNGYLESAPYWLDGLHVIAALNALVVLAVAAVAVWKTPTTHPLFGGLCGLAAMSIVLGKYVVGLDYNGPRTLLPLLLVSILTLSTLHTSERAPAAKAPRNETLRG